MEYIADLWLWLMSHLLFINILLSIAIVFFQRRDPKAVWTWLMALYFVPVFGILFYLILGQDFRKSKIFRLKEADDRISFSAERQGEILRDNGKYIETEFSRDYSRLIMYNLEAGSSIMTVDNKVDIFSDGREKFASLLKDIKSAKKYIHLEYYIIKNDFLFDSISEALIEKALEGVEVRVLVDGMGGRFMPKKKWDRLIRKGIKVAIFFPATLGRINLRINYRNHRKIVVIDGETGYVGGFNIGKEYIGEDKKFGYWRDTHLRLEGESVISLGVRFALDWNYAYGENLFSSGNYFAQKLIEDRAFEPISYLDIPERILGIQIVTSGPDSSVKLIRDNYIELFSRAKHHIYIHTPYFIPDDPIMSALTFAVKSGVEVRLMIPSKPDHPFVYWATLSWAGSLLEEGARVYTYQDGFLHAKSVMVDSRVACLGTANMDIRSFELNFEVNAVIYDSETVVRLENEFLNDIPHCREMSMALYDERGLGQRVREQFSRLLSPLL